MAVSSSAFVSVFLSETLFIAAEDPWSEMYRDKQELLEPGARHLRPTDRAPNDATLVDSRDVPVVIETFIMTSPKNIFSITRR